MIEARPHDFTCIACGCSLFLYKLVDRWLIVWALRPSSEGACHFSSARKMNLSRPTVHPVETPPLTDAADNLQRVRMKDIQGMPGTTGGLVLRSCQFMFAVAALCVMTTTSDFTSVTAFCYLVAVVILQTLWSLSLAFLDIYALLVGRRLRNPRVVCLFTFGDGITSTLTFAAACASAGITVLIGNDIGNCAENHCTRFETATAMAFLSWFAVSPSFLLNFWSLASG